MFETLDEMNRTLPRPKMTGNAGHDQRASDQYIANAKAMRSEAFACVGRSMVKALKKVWHQLTQPGFPERSHHA